MNEVSRWGPRGSGMILLVGPKPEKECPDSLVVLRVYVGHSYRTALKAAVTLVIVGKKRGR